jgi:hypothetical protein
MTSGIQDQTMTSSNNDRFLDPEAHFETPEAVLAAGDLSENDKYRILVNWANDLRQQQVAEEENMRGKPGACERLQAVEAALLVLGREDKPHDAKS